VGRAMLTTMPDFPKRLKDLEQNGIIGVGGMGGACNRSGLYAKLVC
jgi:hypothetical protein